MPDDSIEPREQSRRDLLKKGVVAGAVVWSAPIVTSVGSKAAAFTPVPPDCNLTCSGCGVRSVEYLLIGHPVSGSADWDFVFGAQAPPSECRPCGFSSPEIVGDLAPVVEVDSGGFTFAMACPDGGTVSWQGWSASLGNDCVACDVIDSDEDEATIDLNPARIDTLYITVCVQCDPPEGDDGGSTSGGGSTAGNGVLGSGDGRDPDRPSFAG